LKIALAYLPWYMFGNNGNLMKLQPKHGGFTFLELLAAMALMAVLATSLYSSLHIGFTAKRSAEAAVEPIRKSQIVLGLLQKDIESALPPIGILAGAFFGMNGVNNRGRDSDNLVLYTCNHRPYPDQVGCDIIKVELVLVDTLDMNEGVLIRRTTTNLLAPATPEPVEEVLCRAVTSFNLRYFDGYDWLENWDSVGMGDILPLAVEITLSFESVGKETKEQDDYQVTRAFVILCSWDINEDSTPG